MTNPARHGEDLANVSRYASQKSYLPVKQSICLIGDF